MKMSASMQKKKKTLNNPTQERIINVNKKE